MFLYLQQVITNEHVVAMVKNTILNELASKEDLKEAAYEPKMTRAKVKKVIEETGDVRTFFFPYILRYTSGKIFVT
jgi:hypothetical protein